MQTIQDVMDQAKEKAGLKSDRALSAALGFNPTYATHYRQKGVLPDEDAMLRLGALAGIEPEQALLFLMYWKSKNDTAKICYEKLLGKFGSAAAMALVSVSVMGVTPSSGEAQTSNFEAPQNIYYAPN